MSQMMQSEPYVSLATRRKLSDYSILVDGAALVSGIVLLNLSFFSGALVTMSAGGISLVFAMVNELVSSVRTGITYTDTNGPLPYVTREQDAHQFWLYFGLRILIVFFAVAIPASVLTVWYWWVLT